MDRPVNAAKRHLTMLNLIFTVAGIKDPVVGHGYIAVLNTEPSGLYVTDDYGRRFHIKMYAHLCSIIPTPNNPDRAKPTGNPIVPIPPVKLI